MSSSSAADSAGWRPPRRWRAAPVRVTLRRSPQPPSLSAAALPGRDGDALAGRYRARRSAGCCARAPNVRVLLGERRAVDVAARRVVLRRWRATLDYDYLIVATGARHAYFGHPEWEPFAPGLKTLEDALRDAPPHPARLRARRARRATPARRSELLTFVLVGGGPTGVELAGTLAEIARQTLRDEFRAIDTARARIVVVEAGPSILSTFPRGAARCGAPVARAARRRGARGHARGRHRRARRGRADRRDRERITAGTVLWAAGVAASPLVATLGVPLDRAGRALVEPDLSIPGHPEVFVVGDAASFVHTGDGVPLPGVVQPATQGAAHAARTILRRDRGEPSTPFVYRDLGNMAIVGRASAIADLGWMQLLRSDRLAGVAVPPHRQADRLPQPRGRADRVGGGLRHVSARRAFDHGGRQSGRYVAGRLQAALGRLKPAPTTVAAVACASPSRVRTPRRAPAPCSRPTARR